MSRIDYLKRHRRLLVDMHIGDWDPKALSAYDPAAAVELWKRAGVNAAMFYCQSHVGLCYWPTRVGQMHSGLKGRDIVGETLELLHDHDIAACGYYSVIFNNWAFLEHPEWRIIPASFTREGNLEEAFKKHTGRYGTCCPNHPDYRRFCLAQIGELMATYSFDGFFFDMTFWPKVCVCPQCRRRFREEAGADIPETVDWLDPRWCAFQAARERWLTEFAELLSGAVKSVQPAIPVYHNFAPSLNDWYVALPFGATVHYDFLGADFYGGAEESGVAGKLFQNLTRRRPLELMTSRCETATEHERTKSLEELRANVFTAFLESGAILFIDAVNPEGTLTPAFYDRLRALYEEATPYEAWLGGEPVEEIGVYFSSESRMKFQENGKPLADVSGGSNDYPHAKSIQGMCRILNRNHLPYGIVTRKQLAELGRYRVLILPDVLRMDREEADAFRAYVHNGGKLFATRYTSLTETNGTRGDDFLLADVFGCHFAGNDLTQPTYLRFGDPVLRESISPQRYLSHRVPADLGMLRLRREVEGEALAFLVRSYSNEAGTVFDRKWISIHTSPPWEETDIPALVRHRYGRGECIYSAADLECVKSEANERLLAHLIRGLLGDRPSWGAEAQPFVRMTVFHQVDQKRFRVSFLNCQEQMPVAAVQNIAFHLRPPEGRRFVGLVRIPDGTAIPFKVDRDGCLRATVPHLDLFAMLAAEYA